VNLGQGIEQQQLKKTKDYEVRNVKLRQYVGKIEVGSVVTPYTLVAGYELASSVFKVEVRLL
jgi:hypothetical protein